MTRQQFNSWPLSHWSLVGASYRIFIEGLKSAVTKAAYTYALQKYMNYLGINNPTGVCLLISVAFCQEITEQIRILKTCSHWN
jgi:hypothetical protein